MQNSNRTILVFAPHPDDEVLGVGGTIIKRAKNGDRVIVCIATGGKVVNHRIIESVNANRQMGVEATIFLGYPDLGLDTVPHDIFTSSLVDIIQRYRPDEVYTPHPGDLHTDHKALTAAVMVALRPKYKHTPRSAYTYETLSETGWDYQNPINSFSPNVYVDISSVITEKITALALHESQLQLPPATRSLQAIQNLAAYRGSQAGMYHAEAFTLVRSYES